MPSPIQTNRTLGLAGSTSGDGDDVLVPLELKEPCHRGEGDLAFGQPEFSADLSARTGRIEERIGIHPAVDSLELLGPAHARRQRLLRHRVAHAYNCMTPPRCPPLERDIEAVLDRALKRTKRQPVDRVHDDRDLLVPGGRATENARLRAMGVHDLGLEPPQRCPQPPVRHEIRDRPHRPYQLGKNLDLEVQVLRPVEQVPLGPSAGPVINVTSS